MNVYDFDGTIFNSNCTVGFALWSMKRHPKLLVTYLPGLLKCAIGYKTGKIPNYKFLRKLHSFEWFFLNN